MRRLIKMALLASALVLTLFAQARADFEAPPDEEIATSDEADSSNTRGKVSTKTVVKAGACVGGGGMIAFNPPVPLPKMSKRQQRRFEIEVRRHNRAKVEWGLGCAGIGPVGGSAAIATDDFVSRFITREIPIKRTKRQEETLFYFAGGAPRPDLTGPDPDQYGPK